MKRVYDRRSPRAKLQRAAKAALFVPRRATAGLRLRPDFIIIGGQRCGTTFLYNCLSGHPSVRGAFRKEVHFFDKNFRRGFGWYRAHFPTAAARRVHSLTGGRLVTGEGSPFYLFHPHAAERISRLLPDVRLIALLRNPVDRAYSHYHHEVRLGYETLTFEEALRAEEARTGGAAERLGEDEGGDSFALQHYSYAARGLYAAQLARWLRLFPRERLLFLRSEDLYADARAVVRQTSDFLRLPAWEPEIPSTRASGKYPKMDAALRSQLVARFSGPNRELYELLGRDFGWDR